MLLQASLKVMPNSYKGREEDYKLVDQALIIIKNSNLKNLIGPSETTVEGTQEEVFKLIKDIQDYYYNNNLNFSFFVTFEYNNENFYIENKKENITKI